MAIHPPAVDAQCFVFVLVTGDTRRAEPATTVSSSSQHGFDLMVLPVTPPAMLGWAEKLLISSYMVLVLVGGMELELG